MDRRSLLSSAFAGVLSAGLAQAGPLGLLGAGGQAVAGPPPVSIPVNSVLPVITGTTEVGATLACDTGTWTNTPILSYAYQWKRGGVDIVGANDPTYLQVTADLGANMTCAVIASNIAGPSLAAVSVAVGPVTAATGLVGPAAGWNGIAGSGTAAPTIPAESTPQCIARFLTVSGQRIAANLLVQVPAYSYGGIASVTFIGDWATTVKTAMSVSSFVDGSGTTRTDYCYNITLDWAAFRAANGQAAGACVVKGYAAVRSVLWPTVADRVLGPFYVYPEAAAHDATLNAGSGQTYATLDLAMAAAASFQAPEIVLHGSVAFPLANRTNHTGGNGWLTIRANGSDTPSIGFAARTTLAASVWTPGWDKIEFKGTGLSINSTNTTVINTLGWLNGAKWTNDHVRDNPYWNGSPHPVIGFNVASYFTGSIIEHNQCPTPFQLLCRDLTQRDVFGDMYTATLIAWGNTDSDNNAEVYLAYPTGLTLSCSLPGSTFNLAGGTTLTLTDSNGSLPINLGSIDALVTTTALAATISGRTGWTATAGATFLGARFLAVGGFPNHDSGPLPATSPTALVLGDDVHADWYQTFSGVTNIILGNNTLQDGAGVSKISCVTFFDGALHNMAVFNNAWWPSAAPTATALGGPNQGHLLYFNNTGLISFGLYAGDTLYSLVSENFFWGAATGFPAGTMQFRNNAYFSGSIPAGPQYGGNFNVPSIGGSFVNAAAGNFKPAGTVASTLFPKLRDRDLLMNTVSANDAVGAVSITAA